MKVSVYAQLGKDIAIKKLNRTMELAEDMVDRILNKAKKNTVKGRVYYLVPEKYL